MGTFLNNAYERLILCSTIVKITLQIISNRLTQFVGKCQTLRESNSLLFDSVGRCLCVFHIGSENFQQDSKNLHTDVV